MVIIKLLVCLVISVNCKINIFSCSPKPTGFDFIDAMYLFYLRVLQCSPCDILRFKEASGINDINFGEDDGEAYSNLEQANRGYNLYMASSLSSSDEGFADNLMIYNWAISKKHNYDQVFPSDDMEL